MNLGIYVPTLRDPDIIKDVFAAVNHGIDNEILSDASIFFDDISHTEHSVNCGVFNSTELWNFRGTLITTNTSTTLSAKKIVNNIDLYYYYGLEDNISPLSLIFLIKDRLKVICNSPESKQDFYRKTGKQAVAICENFYHIIQEVKKS